MNRIIRAAYKRLGIVHLGRRRVRDLMDFIEDRRIDIVVDVGANIGQFGESLRADVSGAKLFPLNPLSQRFRYFRRKRRRTATGRRIIAV